MAQQQTNKYAKFVHMVTEENLFKDEIMLDFHSFVHIISGEMLVVQSDKSYTFGADQTMLFPRNQLSSVIKRPKDGRPYKAIVLTLTTDHLEKYYTKNTFKITQSPILKTRIFSKHPLLDSFFASLKPYFDLTEELPDKLDVMKIDEAITIIRSIDPEIDNLLADFSIPGKINLPDFMEKHFMFNMPMEKFGYLTGRSLSTFNRDFKRAFKTTPRDWLMQKRLELAHYQLAEKKRKPVDVYLETGFENLSHFSFVFKKHFGYAPTSLKNQLQ